MNNDIGEWARIIDLKVWEDNPRHNDHAVNEIANSIKRFGFTAPIIARAADKMVLAGHTRLKAAIKLGMEEVPVRYMHLSKQDAKAYALADNKLAEISYWSDDLADLMAELASEDVGLHGLGWSENEIDALMASMPTYIGGERIEEIRAEGGAKRENNNLQKLNGGGGARVLVIGDLRCVLPAAIYQALEEHCKSFESTQNALSLLLSDALQVPREDWEREEDA